MKKLNGKELEAILDEVNRELEPVLKNEVAKAGEKLAKAHPGEATPPEVPADASATKAAPDASKSAPADDSKSAPPKSAEPPKDASPAPDASAAPAPDAPPAPDATAPADDTSDNPEELQAAYASLPLESLQMHYLACKAALIAAMGSDADGDAPASDPTADAAPAAAPAPDATPPAPPPAVKAEIKADAKANGEDPIKAVAKSEKDTEIETLKKTIGDQGAALEKLLTVVQKVVERPMRKSIASIAEVAPATSVDVSKLTKDEVKARLRKVAERPDLKKADRERITSYHLGHITVDGVKDLLTT